MFIVIAQKPGFYRAFLFLILYLIICIIDANNILECITWCITFVIQKRITMTQEQALAALMKLTEKTTPLRISKNSQAFKTALDAITNPGIPQVCGKNIGSGSFASSTSWAEKTAIILRRVGVTFNIENVAPKGGKHGDRIYVVF